MKKKLGRYVDQTVGEKIEKYEKNRAYEPMTVTDWLITFLIQFIPAIGLLMLLYWALSRRTHPSRRSWAQACLLLFVIVGIIIMIFRTLLWGYFLDIFDLL